MMCSFLKGNMAETKLFLRHFFFGAGSILGQRLRRPTKKDKRRQTVVIQTIGGDFWRVGDYLYHGIQETKTDLEREEAAKERQLTFEDALR